MKMHSTVTFSCYSKIPNSVKQGCVLVQILLVSGFSYASSRAHLHLVRMSWFLSDINQPSLPTPSYSVLMSISVFMALSTVFHSINSPDNSPLFRSVLPVFRSALLVLSTIYLFMKVYFSPAIMPSGWLGSKHQLTSSQLGSKGLWPRSVLEVPARWISLWPAGS